MVNSGFPLHSVLNTVLDLSIAVVPVECPQTFRTTVLWVVPYHVVVHLLGSTQPLSGFEVHCSDLAFPQMPMLNGRHLVDTRSEGLFNAS